MASMQSLSDRRVDLYMLKPELLHVDVGWNVRQAGPELDEHIRQLADSIKERGVLEPLTVYLKDGEPTVVNGHCRLAAVKLAISEGAEIKTVPCRVEEKGYNDADRTLSMIVRNSGKPLTPLEMSAVVVRLQRFGWTPADIAKKTAFSRTYIDNLIAMAAAPEEVKTLIKEGKVAPATAMKVLKNEGEKKGAEILKKVVKEQAGKGKAKVSEKHIKATSAAPAPVKRERTVPTVPSANTVLVEKGEYAALLAKSKLLEDVLQFLIDFKKAADAPVTDGMVLRSVELHGEVYKAIYGEVVK